MSGDAGELQKGHFVALHGCCFPATIISALESRGHVVQVKGSFSQTVGGGQAVMRNFATGVNYGASDPRKDGAAIPEPLLKN